MTQSTCSPTYVTPTVCVDASLVSTSHPPWSSWTPRSGFYRLVWSVSGAAAAHGGAVCLRDANRRWTDILPPAQTDQSARTSSHRSARSDRIEIVTRSERRRWSLEQKREIVAESLGPGLTPTEVARKYAISSGQLYTWRRELLSVQTSIITRATPRFAEVETESAPQQMGAKPAPTEAHLPCTSTAPPRPDGLIELVMPSGVVVRMDAHVDSRALRRILGALEEQ